VAGPEVVHCLADRSDDEGGEVEEPQPGAEAGVRGKTEETSN